MSWLRNLCVSLWVPTLFVSESTYVGHVSLRTTRPHRHALKLVGTTPSKYYVYRVCGDVAVASSSSSSSFFFFFNAISFCDSFICLSPFLEREREMQWETKGQYNTIAFLVFTSLPLKIVERNLLYFRV